MLRKLVLILGGLFLMFVLAIAVGLGVWAYSLNTQLGNVTADLQALKSTHEKLNSDYSDLSSGSAKTNADLAAATAEIQSLQSQLKSEQAENDSYKTRLSAAQAKVSILYALEFASRAAIEAKIKASGDEELQALWAKAEKSQSDEDSWKLWDYVIQSVADAIGLGGSSNVSG